MTTVVPPGRACLLRLFIGLVFALAACGGPPPDSPDAAATTSPPSASVSAASREAIAAELDRLLSELERIHPDPFHAVPRNEFVAALEEYEAGLPELTPEEATVGLMRVWALLSRDRDSRMCPSRSPPSTTSLAAIRRSRQPSPTTDLADIG